MNTLLKQAIAANRAMVFRDWHAQLNDADKAKLKKEMDLVWQIPPEIAPGVSISEAFAVAGALLADGVMKGLNQ